MKISKPYTNEQYAELAIYCNENNCNIEDKGDYLEIVRKPAPTSEELAQREIFDLKQKLDNSDYAIIKIAESAATAEEYADLIAQRAAWRARINELEAEFAK